MKKALLLLAALALLLTMQSSVDTAYAHGGAYRGPAGEVPPGQRDPKDPQPPPENPATPTPGPGGGTGSPPPGPPPSGGDGGDTPDAPPPPPKAPDGPGGNNGPGGLATPGGKKRAAPKMMSFENWLFWWAYNKDEILNLKARLKARESSAASGSSRVFIGKGKGGTGKQSATPQMIKTMIVPALEKIVDNAEVHPDIRGGALIALARAEPTKKYLDRFFAISKDKDQDKVVQESAIIALGILQIKEPEVRDHLISLVEDRDYPMRGRCFAMLALGLLQDSSDEAFKALEGRLDGTEVHLDVPVCALLSIGLIGHEKKVPQLIEWLEAGKIGREKISDLERAWVVAALGKIGHEDALKPISKVLREKGRYAKRSAAIAIGQIASQLTDEAEQQKYAKMLMNFHKSESDLTSKNYALTSLGRIGGHANATEKVRDGVKVFLKLQFKEVNKTTERPFVALSMGLLGFDGQTAKPQALKEELASVIRPALEARKGDKTALGALAVSLGMLQDKGSVELLMSILGDRGMDKKLRGAAAMSLGLIGDNKADDVILKALKEREDRDLRVDTAVAAGLLGSTEAVDELVKVLNDKKASQFVLGSVALALGQIGDSRAIEPMVMILEPGKTNGTYPDLTRALVAVALGQLSDRRDTRVLYKMSKDINYRASVPALDEILTIL